VVDLRPSARSIRSQYCTYRFTKDLPWKRSNVSTLCSPPGLKTFQNTKSSNSTIRKSGSVTFVCPGKT
jgi:hypothetical protein